MGSGAFEAQFLLPHECDMLQASASARVALFPFLSPFPEACMNLMKSLLPVKFDPIGYFQLRINRKTDGAVI